MNRLFEESLDYALGGEGIVFEESINDKNLFKAVFMAGGPGSGKGYVVNKIFKGSTAKIINSDEAFEFLLVKNNLPLKIDDSKVELYKKQTAQRDRAKEIVGIKKDNFINGMLPVVIDGTGKDYDEIAKAKSEYEALGYDCSLVFVNTTLEVAKARNLKRSRTVPDSVVENSWKKVQNNIGKFQSLFGREMYIVDNSEVLEGAELEKFSAQMHKISTKILSSPLRNRLGQVTIETLKKIGGKYLTDLPTTTKN